jgi:hypothetical protein
MVLPNRCNHALSGLVPTFINGLGLIDLGQLKSLNRCRGLKHIFCGHEIVCELWVVCAELSPLFITQGLILSILKYLQLEASGVKFLVRLLLRGLLGNNSCNCGCLRGLFKVALALEILLWDSIVLSEKLQDPWLIRSLCELEGCLIFMINICSLSSTLQKILNNVNLVSLDSIVNRCLLVVVNQVWIASIGNQLLDNLHMSLSRSIKDRRLPVSVNIVHIAVALSDKIVKEVKLTVTRSVVKRSLIQVIRLFGSHTEFPQDFGHANCLVITLDLACREHRRLLVVSLIEKLRDVVVCLVTLLQD